MKKKYNICEVAIKHKAYIKNDIAVCQLDKNNKCSFLWFKMLGQIPVCVYGQEMKELNEYNEAIIPKEDCKIWNELSLSLIERT